MADTDRKNHYETLGVSRDASPDQIKKAYRKMARKYHPDVSKEDDAEARMQEVNVAYDVLSDENKKKEYDFQLDHPEGFGSADGQGAYSGFDHTQFYRSASQDDSSAFSGFEDLFGRFGSGFGGGRREYSGRAQQQPFKGEDQHAKIDAELSAAYHGNTQQLVLQISTFNAYGEPEVQRKTLQVKIPAGLKDGQQIRLSGQGQTGINGGPNGDLYIEVHYPATNRYRVDGADVYFNLDITPWEAALGQCIHVSLPNSSEVEIHLPKNARTGQQLRLKEKGIPGKTAGNLFLVLNIVLPAAQTDQQQQAYRDFADAFDQFNPRQP